MNVDKAMEGYENARENYIGWCLDCDDWTRDSTEPDAEDYDCPVCDGKHVIGADLVLERIL